MGSRGVNVDDNDDVDDNDHHNNDDKDHDEHHNQNDQQSNYNARFQPSPLDLLSSEHKRLLLQDLKESQPPLFPPVLRHTPISYKATKSSRNTSLGSLDQTIPYQTKPLQTKPYQTKPTVNLL